MKVTMYKPVAEEEKKVQLKMREDGNGVTVFCVDKNGDRISSADLVTFRTDGSMAIHSGVNPSIGLKLDGDKRIAYSS